MSFGGEVKMQYCPSEIPENNPNTNEIKINPNTIRAEDICEKA